jgi:hypothetical protein
LVSPNGALSPSGEASVPSSIFRILLFRRHQLHLDCPQPCTINGKISLCGGFKSFFASAPSRPKARNTRRTRSSSGSSFHPRFGGRQKSLPLQFLASKFSRPSDGFCLFANFPLGGFFVMLPELHFTKDAFTLHLFLQHPEGLVDIVVADENLHVISFSVDLRNGQGGGSAYGYSHSNHLNRLTMRRGRAARQWHPRSRRARRLSAFTRRRFCLVCWRSAPGV